MPSIFDEEELPQPEQEQQQMIRPYFEPDSQAETARKSGLAYSAGIVFFGSVAFMLLLGWGADLILGSSPWGIVGGVVIGSIIGFVQFVRITSRIHSKPKDGPAIHPLMSSSESDEQDPSRF